MKETFIALFNHSREISGKGYCRIKMKCSNKFHFNRYGFLANDEHIIFPKARSNWGKVTHFALIIQSTKGDSLLSLKGKLIKVAVIKSGNTAVFEAGHLQIELSKFRSTITLT